MCKCVFMFMCMCVFMCVCVCVCVYSSNPRIMDHLQLCPLQNP